MFQSKNFKIQTFVNEETKGNMYLVCFNNSYLIVDPTLPYSTVENLIENKKCVGIFLTHAHYDHFSEAQSYIDQNLTFYMHENAKQKLLENDGTCIEMFENAIMPKFADAKIKTLKENDSLEIEETLLKVVELFGHTNCSIGFLIDDCFFVGDCIFAGGNIGRYDLKTGSGFQTRATLRKLKTLDLYLNIFPGHNETFKLKEFWNR